MRRAVSSLAAAACLALAAGLVLLARDVARWRDSIEAGDVRYQVAPRDRGLWAPVQSVPFEPARSLLAVDDDVEFRQALRALRLAGIGEPAVSDPAVVLRRNEARARLAAAAGSDPDPRRRSRAMGLLGVVSYASAVSFVEDATPLLRDALVRFRAAIALDPNNDEAKTNLEFALQRDREAAAGGGGERPTPGGEGAAGAGAREAGTGY